MTPTLAQALAQQGGFWNSDLGGAIGGIALYVGIGWLVFLPVALLVDPLPPGYTRGALLGRVAQAAVMGTPAVVVGLSMGAMLGMGLLVQSILQWPIQVSNKWLAQPAKDPYHEAARREVEQIAPSDE